MKLNKVKLGNQGLVIPNIGLGCMGMTGFGDADMYGKSDEKEELVLSTVVTTSDFET